MSDLFESLGEEEQEGKEQRTAEGASLCGLGGEEQRTPEGASLCGLGGEEQRTAGSASL